jgi:hypothetical protein
MQTTMRTGVRGALVAIVALLALPGAATAKKNVRDGDAMPASWERKYGLDPRRDDGARDKDRDGVSNEGEYIAKTKPNDLDSDNDGVDDGAEDPDRDRVDTGNEERQETHSRRRDSDRDGVDDGREDSDEDGLNNANEDLTGDDPADPDSDDNGTLDGDEGNGRIVAAEDMWSPEDENPSYDVYITVRLFAGGTVSGLASYEHTVLCNDADKAALAGPMPPIDPETGLYDEDHPLYEGQNEPDWDPTGPENWEEMEVEGWDDGIELVQCDFSLVRRDQIVRSHTLVPHGDDAMFSLLRIAK